MSIGPLVVSRLGTYAFLESKSWTLFAVDVMLDGDTITIIKGYGRLMVIAKI